MLAVRNGPKSRSGRFADTARAALRDSGGSLATRINGRICWDAVFEVARASGAITTDAVTALKAETIPAEPNRFTAMYGHRINNATEMQAAPEGHFLAFVRVMDGAPRLSHMMVTLGDGVAAGTNNGAIGGLSSWSAMNIARPTAYLSAGTLAWTNEGFQFNNSSFEVYHRPIDALEHAACIVQ